MKAVNAGGDEFAWALYEREAQVALALPGALPTPQCLGVIRVGGWLALVFEDAGAPAVQLPWDRARLDSVLDEMARMTAVATPTPVQGLGPWGGDLELWRNWERMAADASAPHLLPPGLRDRVPDLVGLEARLATAREGETLLHSDLRSDNIVIRPDHSVLFVDWAQAAIGAAWIDPLIFALCAAVQGERDPEGLLLAHPAGRRAPAHDVDSVLAALAGRFTRMATTPGPAAVRRFQRAESEVTLQWLGRRMEW